ncbi:MAG: periplasmic heavy metal sensor [Pirellulaceae bacterium]|nr:periplasmic heavy metal sensor [Pirellulaceae bacterium]
MWQHAKPYLLALSAALNLSFVAMWVAYAAPLRLPDTSHAPNAEQEVVWCPLHRELEVTLEQWQQIEPRLQQFQSSVGDLCQQIELMRVEVIDLLAAEQPDLDAVRAKQDEILAAKRTMQDTVASHLLAEKEILTAQQQQRLFQRLRDRTGCAGTSPPMSGRNRQRGVDAAVLEDK